MSDPKKITVTLHLPTLRDQARTVGAVHRWKGGGPTTVVEVEGEDPVKQIKPDGCRRRRVGRLRLPDLQGSSAGDAERRLISGRCRPSPATTVHYLSPSDATGWHLCIRRKPLPITDQYIPCSATTRAQMNLRSSRPDTRRLRAASDYRHRRAGRRCRPDERSRGSGSVSSFWKPRRGRATSGRTASRATP
jgi:hypothetical protein